MSPQIWIVREKPSDGEPCSGLVFGAFTQRKAAVKLRRDLGSKPTPPCAEIEILALRLGYRYEEGAA